MMTNLEHATLEEYGYKNHKIAKKAFKIFNYVIICLVVFMLYLSVLIIALQSFNASRSTTEFTGFTFKWYQEMFSNRLLTVSIRNTFLVSIIATLISTCLGTVIAIGISYLPAKAKNKILLLNNIPLLNADIVTGISMMLLFSLLLPIFPHIFGFTTLLIAHVFFTLPYVILNVLPKMKEIDPNLMDAALDLGVKPIPAMLKVIIPAVKAGIFSGAVLAFTITFEDFVVSYFATGNGFDTMSIWIYSSIGKKSLFPGVYAFNTLLTFGTMAILVIYNFVKGRKKREKKTN